MKTIVLLFPLLVLSTAAALGQENVGQSNQDLLAAPLSADEIEIGSISLGSPDAPEHFSIVTDTDWPNFKPVVEAFVALDPGVRITVEILPAHALYQRERTACENGEANADLVLSSSAHLMVDLVNRGCGHTYTSRLTRALPTERRWRDQLWGVTIEPIVIAFNRELLGDDFSPGTRIDFLKELRAPGGLEARQIVTYDIDTAEVGLLVAILDAIESSSFGSLFQRLGADGSATSCATANMLDGISRGEWALAYNVLGSYAVARARTDPKIGVTAFSDYTIMISRAAMIPRYAAAAPSATKFLEYLLSEVGQVVLSENDFLFDPATAVSAGGESIVQLAARERVVDLSPTLLIAVDAQKRALYQQLWDTFFSVGDGVRPKAPCELQRFG